MAQTVSVTKLSIDLGAQIQSYLFGYSQPKQIFGMPMYHFVNQEFIGSCVLPTIDTTSGKIIQDVAHLVADKEPLNAPVLEAQDII